MATEPVTVIKKKGTNPLVIGIIVVVVLLFCCCGFLGFSSLLGNTTTPKSTVNSITKEVINKEVTVVQNTITPIKTATPTAQITATNKPAPTSTIAPTLTLAPTSSVTVSQKNALAKAKSYLAYTAFSHDGLVEQLEYEQFSHADAVYGADYCGADWNEQAAKKAKSYMEYSAFSRGSLIEQLKYEKFTQAQAEYGANSVGL
jgi:hypothetical protein